MPSHLNIWANQMDPIIPQRLRTKEWRELIAHCSQTTMRYDAQVRAYADDWVYRRLLPMLTPVASFSDEGDEWRAMIDRRMLNMYRFKNHTLNKILGLLGQQPIPQYGEATKLALREIHTLRKIWRGFHVPWQKDLDINNTLLGMHTVAEYGNYSPTQD